MPSNFETFMNYLSPLNLNLFTSLPIACSGVLDNFFTSELLLLTLAPIGISVFFLLAYSMECLYIKLFRREDRGGTTHTYSPLAQTKDKYINYFFYLTYLVLPSVTTTIFKTFLCTDISDNNEPELVLTVDMKISCSSPYYQVIYM